MLELKIPSRRRLSILSSSTSPKSKINSENRFLKKYYIITVLNFLEPFDQYLKKSKKKNGFFILFSNLSRPMAGVILEILYGFFKRVFSPFLPNKHRPSGFFFRFKDGLSKLILYLRTDILKDYHPLGRLSESTVIP